MDSLSLEQTKASKRLHLTTWPFFSPRPAAHPPDYPLWLQGCYPPPSCDALWAAEADGCDWVYCPQTCCQPKMPAAPSQPPAGGEEEAGYVAWWWDGGLKWSCLCGYNEVVLQDMVIHIVTSPLWSQSSDPLKWNLPLILCWPLGLSGLDWCGFPSFFSPKMCAWNSSHRWGEERTSHQSWSFQVFLEERYKVFGPWKRTERSVEYC